MQVLISYNQAHRGWFAGSSDLLNVTEAHYGGSYGWIFDIPEDEPNGGGVKKRD